jgi:methionyl-tRNA formyltransferase
MRVLYLGLPLGAAVLARHGFAPDVACIWHLDAPGLRRLRTLAARPGRLVLGRPDLDAADLQYALRTAAPDLILSWFWPRRIPAEVLALAPRGAFGVHPSLLPRWRGPDPYFWAIRSGDAETGVTLHRLEPEYDTGAIVAQRTVAIDDDDDAWTLARRLDRPSLALLVDCAQRLSRGEALPGTPQDESLATPAPQPGETDLAISFRAPAHEVVRLVRAASPAPGATCLLGETLVTVMQARIAAGRIPRVLEPGEAWVDEDGALAVRTPDGGVVLDVVRDEDDVELAGEDVAALVAD